MAWIPIYTDETDFDLILEKLNTDPEIAFIQPNGTKKWIAKEITDRIDDGEHCLWHIPGGQIRLYREGGRNVFGRSLSRLFNAPSKVSEESGFVGDPWTGWKGPHISSDKKVPFLGSHPNIIQLTVKKSSTGNTIGMSGFGWIANRYGPIGYPADKRTVNWWNRLKHWISKHSAAKITRFGPLNEPDPQIWAFESAYRKILDGAHREPNPSA